MKPNKLTKYQKPPIDQTFETARELMIWWLIWQWLWPYLATALIGYTLGIQWRDHHHPQGIYWTIDHGNSWYASVWTTDDLKRWQDLTTLPKRKDSHETN